MWIYCKNNELELKSSLKVVFLVQQTVAPGLLIYIRQTFLESDLASMPGSRLREPGFFVLASGIFKFIKKLDNKISGLNHVFCK